MLLSATSHILEREAQTGRVHAVRPQLWACHGQPSERARGSGHRTFTPFRNGPPAEGGRTFALQRSLLCSGLVAWAAAAYGAERLALIRPGRAMPAIVVGREATKLERFAAEELRTYLGKMTGREIEIVDDEDAPAANYIAVGRSHPPKHRECLRLCLAKGRERGVLAGPHGTWRAPRLGWPCLAVGRAATCGPWSAGPG